MHRLSMLIILYWSRQLDIFYGVKFLSHWLPSVSGREMNMQSGNYASVFQVSRELLSVVIEEIRNLFWRYWPEPVLSSALAFHSIVLGMNFCKPVFPIIYNCKTEHFLSDIHFAGRFAGLSDLNSATLEDVLYNYEHHIVADCTMLRRCAVNQFRGLENYLEEKTT